MGVVLGWGSCCHSSSQHQESCSKRLHSESSNSTYLSSQPSLPSVPSLSTPQPPKTTALTAHYQLLTTIKGHSSPVSSLALQGKFLYTGSTNSEIRTCAKDPCALQQTSSDAGRVVAVSNGAVKSLVVLGDKLFSAHQDHKIRVWKMEPNQRCKCIATLPTFCDRFTKLLSSNNYVEVRRHKRCTWVHHVDTVSALALSHDNSLLYSASWDRTFKVWRTSDFKCLESVNAHEDAVNALALSRDGFLYTGSADTKIKIWNKKKETHKSTHSLVGTLEKHKSAVNALALSTDWSVLYSGACDRSILVWEREEAGGGTHMVLVGALRGHSKAILCLVVVSDLVFSGSADNTVRVWRRGLDRTYSCLAVLEGHRRPVKCLVVAVDSNSGDDDLTTCSNYLVYSASLDCDIAVWRIRLPLF